MANHTESDHILPGLAVVALAFMMQQVGPNWNIFGVSLFGIVGLLTAVTLVLYIVFVVSPRNRAARDARTKKNAD